MRTLHVAVGVVKNASGQVLISLRDPALHQGGLWEFPGGKIESGESAEQALHRELKEELDITPLTATPLITINHQYPDRAVTLHVFLVDHFQGVVKHADDQPIEWTELGGLSRYRFPAANASIITASRLPPYYAILDDEHEWQLLPNLKLILARGVKLIQARLKSLPATQVKKFMAEAYPLCKQQNALLLINSAVVFTAQTNINATGFHHVIRKTVADDCRDAGGTTPWMGEVESCQEQRSRATQGAVADDCRDAGGRATQEAVADDCRDAGGRATQGAVADGIHLTSRHLLSLEKRPKHYLWVAASCHNLQELLHAQQIGIDFAVLAPVLPTKTHPEAKPLGWEQFSKLVAEINIPVYALGGMSERWLETARQAGGQGIAGIRAFLD